MNYGGGGAGGVENDVGNSGQRTSMLVSALQTSTLQSWLAPHLCGHSLNLGMGTINVTQCNMIHQHLNTTIIMTTNDTFYRGFQVA